MRVYFVTIGKTEEIQVIKKVKPPRLLVSYWYFKNKPLSNFIKELGYHPEIMLDSGAYSAHRKGRTLDTTAYMEYIRSNKEHISRYVTMDVIGDSQATHKNYEQMRQYGFNPIPVVHYGADVKNELGWYVNQGAETIALGGTVMVKDKKEVADWCIKAKQIYPNCKFHLLGSCSLKILQSGALDSCDASTWYVAAINGKPSSISGRNRDAKIARAEFNLKKIMGDFNEISISDDNCLG